MTTAKEEKNLEETGSPTLPALSDAEKDEAAKQGVKDAIAEAAAAEFRTHSETQTDSGGDRWPDRSDVQQWARLLDLSQEEFVKALSEKAEKAVPESKVAGLLEMERSGKNRTAFVEVMMKRLGVKSVYEVTRAGPGHTNDVTPVRKLTGG